MIRTRFIRRWLVVAIAATIAVLSVGGCASVDPSRSGAAVIIEGDRITIDELQDKVELIAQEREAAGAQPVPAADESRQQIQRMIVHRILENAAAAHDIAITPSEIDQRIAELEQQFGGADAFAAEVAARSIASTDVRTFISDDLMVTRIGEALVPGAASQEELARRQDELNEFLIATARELEVTVNPRYGTFNPETGQVDPPESPAVQPAD